MNVVGQNPQLANKVNWDEVLMHITSLMVPSLSDKLLASAMPASAETVPNPAGILEDSAMAEGGAPNVRRLQAAEMAGTLEQELQQRLQQTGGQ